MRLEFLTRLFIFVLWSIWPNLLSVKIDFFDFIALFITYIPMIFVQFIFLPCISVLVPVALTALELINV